MTDLKKLLNNEQYLSVTHKDGPSVILAGAGSGKTRVITYKIAYLISQGVAPDKILAVTFTNKAAKEMKERVAALLPKMKDKPFISIVDTNTTDLIPEQRGLLFLKILLITEKKLNLFSPLS